MFLVMCCPLCDKPFETHISANDCVEQIDIHVEDEHRDWEIVGYLSYAKKNVS